MASELSFHCMICFEEFSHTLYPVVLPCGHTYICVECASRIDKCMECRKSLYVETESENEYIDNESFRANAIQSSAYASSSTISAVRSGRRQPSRMSRMSRPKEKIRPKPKQRLPLPKNAVLMSLIEVSNLASEKDISLYQQQRDEADQLDPEELRITMSTDLAVSSCGTYAVARDDGLDIYPTMSKKHAKAKSSRTLSKSFSEDKKLMGGNLLQKMKSCSSAPCRHPFVIHLECGDRIQVVTIVNNWAKLARGYGYVYIEKSTDIIKVCGVLDKACNIESMLYVLSYKREKAVNQKSRIEKHAVTLMHELHGAMKSLQDLTVIGAEAFSSRDLDDHIDLDTRDDELLLSSEDTRDDNESCTTQSTQCTEKSRISPTNSTSSGLFSDWLPFRSRETPRVSHDPTMVSRAMLASAESWRKRNGREAASGVNFRTGISSHKSGLGHGHQEFGLPKMSSHGGLTPNRRKNSGRKSDFAQIV